MLRICKSCSEIVTNTARAALQARQDHARQKEQTMPALNGKIAVVTGASRGVGRGIALGLGEAGATVYVTGRTAAPGAARLRRTIYDAAEEVTRLGGKGIAVQCDQSKDNEVEAAFSHILEEAGQIDILVNNAWGGYENMVENGEFTWEQPFWEQPMWRWEVMLGNVRGYFVASRCAAPSMIAQGSGLIVNISFWAAQKHLGNAIYGVAKAATDKLAADFAHELRPHHVAAVSLYPGLVRTEGVMENAHFFDMSNSESPQYVGRAVAALASDARLMEKSGQVLLTAALGQEYGFADIDGKVIRPITLAEV
jgi:dehydrogenase/reductase SDR family member 1